MDYEKIIDLDKELDYLMKKGTEWLKTSLMCLACVFLSIPASSFLFDDLIFKILLIGITLLLFLFNWIKFSIYAHNSFLIRVQKEMIRLNRKESWEKSYKDVD